MANKKNAKDSDLTRIEDLSEFYHQEDSDLDSKFESFLPSSDSQDSSLNSGIDLESLDESPPEIPMEIDDNLSGTEETFNDETSSEESSFSFNTSFESEELTSEDAVEESNDELLIDESPLENELGHEESLFDSPEETQDSTTYNFQEEIEISPPKQQDPPSPKPEKFEDVKTFAQNFSYGTSSGRGGNPPYTMILRNIKYKDDAEDILNLLKEFGILNGQSESDIEKALEMGSVIIPQISEYTAIVLAHKFRRYDLDIEVGLSDEIHPSKSGEQNPKGLIKKENIKQNRAERLNLKEIKTPINEIIVSTSSSLPGYTIEHYLGVETTFAIVDEEELERLQYVQKTEREKSAIEDYDILDSEDLPTAKAFRDYQNSFALLYHDLSMQLKQKAFSQNANALLGLNFQLSSIQFDRNHRRVNAYQITCSGSIVIVGPETN